jgi:uncharacterized protein YbaA (DUF1428 family)
MKRYVDGYVLPVSKRKLKSYKKVAAQAGKIWIKYGALQYVECVADDLETVKKWGGLPFPKLAKTKKGETVIFAYVVYKSKAHRDRVNAKITKEFDSDSTNKDQPMPFELKRMAYAGFETIVNLAQKP